MSYTGPTIAKPVKNGIVEKLVECMVAKGPGITYTKKEIISLGEDSSLREYNNFHWTMRALRYKLNSRHNLKIAKKGDNYTIKPMGEKTQKDVKKLPVDNDRLCIEVPDISDILSDGTKPMDRINRSFNSNRLNRKIVDTTNPAHIIFLRNMITEEILRRSLKDMSLEELCECMDATNEPYLKITTEQSDNT